MQVMYERSTHLDRLTLPPKPLQSPRIVLQQRGNLIPSLLMVLVQPLLLLFRQKRRVDELGLDWAATRRARLVYDEERTV